MKIINIVEDLIWQHMDEVINSKPGMCNCEVCRLDVAAYALNRIKPYYAVNSRGETIARAQFLNTQLSLDIIIVLTEAVNVVYANPRHDKDKKI